MSPDIFTAPPPAQEPRRAALVFIFVTVALDMLALGIIIPVLPKLVLEFRGGSTVSGPGGWRSARRAAAPG